MAITAVAAIAGAASVGTTIAGITITASTLAMVSVGVTVVGMVTKSKTLMKIGGGLGLGAMGASMLGLGQSAAANAAQAAVSAESAAANEAAQASANAAWSQGGAAEVAGMAQDAANASWAQGGAAEVAASQPQGIADAMAGTDPSAPRGFIESNMAEAGTASQAAPASQQAATAADASAGASSQYGLASPKPSLGLQMKPTVDASQLPGMNTLERGSTWFDKIGEFWNGLDKSGKLAVGQAASGLVSGIGQGALRYMAADEQRKFEQQQINQRRADRGFVPDLTPYSR